MYPTPLAYYLIRLRKIYDHLGPCLGTPSASTLPHTSPFYFVHFSVTLVKLLVATSPFICFENLDMFFLHCKPWKTETMGFLNIKIGQTLETLWACKLRWSQMKQEKVAFFSPPSFRCSTGKWRRKKLISFLLLKTKDNLHQFMIQICSSPSHWNRHMSLDGRKGKALHTYIPTDGHTILFYVATTNVNWKVPFLTFT